MGYFTETMSMLNEMSEKAKMFAKKCTYAYDTTADAMKDSAFSIAGALWAQCFSTSKYLTYKCKSNGKKYTGVAAFNKAYSDYCNKAAKDAGLKKLSASMNAGDVAIDLCKKANKKEEYDLNKILGI